MTKRSIISCIDLVGINPEILSVICRKFYKIISPIFFFSLFCLPYIIFIYMYCAICITIHVYIYIVIIKKMILIPNRSHQKPMRKSPAHSRITCSSSIHLVIKPLVHCIIAHTRLLLFVDSQLASLLSPNSAKKLIPLQKPIHLNQKRTLSLQEITYTCTPEVSH